MSSLAGQSTRSAQRHPTQKESFRVAALAFGWATAFITAVWLLVGRSSMALLEGAIVLGAWAMALLRPNFGARYFRALDRGLSRLGARRRTALLLTTGTGLMVRAVLLPVVPVPSPRVNDEFSYLLAADTYASGRLTNPTHPKWMHFETFHVDQRPTYTSMYPPGQGLALAAGKALTGSPWVGVWLSSGLMCLSVCWALQRWLPPRWALWGGLFCAVRFGVLSYFANSYWGGALSATGGALIIGALPRLNREANWHNALAMGVGLAILANTRPFEGALFGLASLAVVLIRAVRARALNTVPYRKVALTLGVMALLVGGAMVYYNKTVFGAPHRLPYQVNRTTYAVAPVFLWQQVRPSPHYNHEVIRNFFLGWELDKFRQSRSVSGILAQAHEKAFLSWHFYIGPAMTLPFICLPLLMPKIQLRPLWIIGGTVLAGLSSEIFFAPHYAAPLLSVLLIFQLSAMRYLGAWRWRGKKSGLFLVRVTLPICVCVLLFGVFGSRLWAKEFPTFLFWTPDPTARDMVIGQLQRTAGRHLVIVRYDREHNPYWEWVYNAADIDRASIVWARDLGEKANADLIRYYRGRRIWLFEPDRVPPGLSLYEEQGPTRLSLGDH